MSEVGGAVAPGYEAVRAAFAKGQAADAGGAQLCVYRRGEIVVDLWTGRDLVNDRPFTPDLITVLMSCTKPAASLCALILADRGQLDLDAPVATYWPEFAAEGKEAVTVTDLLAHRSGLAAFDAAANVGIETLLDWDAATAALAAQKPLWAPGTAYIYHFFTHGFLIGEVVRRISGRSLGSFFEAEIARPLGLDFWIGLPDSQAPRVVPHLRPGGGASEDQLRANFQRIGVDPDDRFVLSLIRTMTSTDALIEAMNTQPYRAAEIPAGNGVGNARSLAKMYAAVVGEVDGKRIISPAMLERARQPQTDHLKAPPPLEILSAGPAPQRFGLGFELPRAIMPMMGEGSLGHPGAGGRLGYGDPETGIAVGYACNTMPWDGATADARWIWNDALREVVLGR